MKKVKYYSISLCNPQDVFLFFWLLGSERTMDLVLEMCDTSSVHWCGVSGRQLGKLLPSASLGLALTLLSSVQGLQVSCSPALCWLMVFIRANYQWMKIEAHIFVSIECLRLETDRHVPEENIWIRWHRTSLCGLFSHPSGKLMKISNVMFSFSFR